MLLMMLMKMQKIYVKITTSPRQKYKSTFKIRSKKSKEVDIIYVPSHLHHICFELFKNAMRASMEVSDNNELDEIPKIKVTVTKGDHDCCIRISDMGGGASRQVVMRWMEYLYP